MSFFSRTSSSSIRRRVMEEIEPRIQQGEQQFQSDADSIENAYLETLRQASNSRHEARLKAENNAVAAVIG